MIAAENIISEYADNLEADGYAESTVKMYSSQVRQAFKADAFSSVPNFNKFIKERRAKIADNTFNAQIDALSNFLKYEKFLAIKLDELIREKISIVSSNSRISQPKLVQERRAYTKDEIIALQNLETQPWRWHFLHIGLNFGLRSNEIRSLRFDNFDLENRYLNVPAPITKSKRFRYIPISRSVYPVINTRVKLLSNTQKFYLEARRGKKVSDRSAQYWNSEEEQCGFKIMAHNLRYTFATQLWKETGNIILIQKYLGHASPEITWRYLKLKREDLDDQFLRLDFKVI